MNNDVNNKSIELNNLIIELASSQEYLKDALKRKAVYKKLEEIYYSGDSEDKFRHYYSEIFIAISQINDDAKKSIDVLAENIKYIKKGYQPRENKDVSNEINKLYDHINLEIARLSYSKITEMKKESMLKELQESLSSTQKQIAEMNSSVENAKNIQREYTTILGIFASIVLAFVGGLVFSTSILQYINEVSVYRIVLLFFGLAFVLINTIYLLTRFIQEINKSKNEKIKYPKYMLIINGILIFGAFVTVLCWIVDINNLRIYLRELIFNILKI